MSLFYPPTTVPPTLLGHPLVLHVAEGQLSLVFLPAATAQSYDGIDSYLRFHFY